MFFASTPLNVVADADLRMRGHGAAVGIGQRDLVLAGSVELGQHRFVTAALFVERRNLFGQVLRARAAPGRAILDIALVEPLEVVFQPLVGAADELSQRRAGEVAILVVDRLDAGSVDRQQLAAVQVEASAQQYELAEHGAKRRAIVAPESQRDLVLAGSVELGQHRLVTAALLAERRNLFGQVLRACAAACRAVLDIALVEPLEVVFQPLVGAADELSQRRAGEVAILVVDRLDAGSVRSRRRHSNTNWRNTVRNAARLSRRKSAMVLKSGFQVRNSQRTSMLR